MADIVLTERQQDSLRRLVALDVAPGALPSTYVLDLVSRLVPSDVIDIHLADSTGCVVDIVSLPADPLGRFDPQVCDGPLPLGMIHQSRDPDHQDDLRPAGVADGIVIGFRCGPDHVVQLSMDRYSRTFSDCELALLRMISPALQRLMRSQPTPCLPESLTLTERRVLQLVATGRSNSEIAADLYVSVATVRKHLENAYRKLGVHSRMAAVVAFQGRPRADVPDAEQIDKYA